LPNKIKCTIRATLVMCIVRDLRLACSVQKHCLVRTNSREGGNIMNWDQVEGQWKQLKGQVREKWAKLTDDDFESIAGKKDRLMGKLQTHYGKKKDDAEKEIDAFIAGIKSTTDKAAKRM
jgi:uncharacterized protein YjbJ (UPF0337 family)